MSGSMLVDEVPTVEARGGMFYIHTSAGDFDFACTPHVFLAITQRCQRSYAEWARAECEVVRARAHS